MLYTRFVTGEEALWLALLMHGEQCSGLGGQSVLHWGHRLVAVGERGRHNYVELKFARRDVQSGKLHLRRHVADGEYGQRRQSPRLRFRPAVTAAELGPNPLP
jgi:hypothetical protein